MKSQTCCFTGHRRIPLDSICSLEYILEKTILDLIVSGVIFFGSGGALGFDTLASQTVLKLKKTYPQIRLILVLPCKNQHIFWHRSDKDIFEHILSQADKIVYTSIEYYDGCMQKRNRHLVEHSSYCISYVTCNASGSAYTLRYALLLGLNIIAL